MDKLVLDVSDNWSAESYTRAAESIRRVRHQILGAQVLALGILGIVAIFGALTLAS